MRHAVRQLIVLFVVAVMAFGGSVSFAAPLTLAHNHTDAIGGEQAVLSLHHHLHGHGDDDVMHAEARSQFQLDHCLGADCDDSNHANHPCCHMHAHCCTSLLSLVADGSAYQRMLGKGSLLTSARAAIPLGTITYPLLRPPRAFA